MRGKMEFFDRQAERWDAMRHGAAEQGRLDGLVGRFGLRAGDTVLDLGCGTGRATPLLLRAAGAGGRVVCADFSAGMLREASRKRGLRGAGFVQARAEEIPCADGSFDAVVCYCAFPHFEAGRALGEIRRILRAGGRLVIAHPLGSAEINEIHKRAGGAVSKDVMAPAPAMGTPLRAAGFRPLRLVDRPGTYLVIALKE
ncbi:MAG: methyltransferase domain-containing protein [bacterium]|nr:methyltransferase domain-containing protein [bacterium]